MRRAESSSARATILNEAAHDFPIGGVSALSKDSKRRDGDPRIVLSPAVPHLFFSAHHRQHLPGVRAGQCQTALMVVRMTVAVAC
jgi:hypothetical protein